MASCLRCSRGQLASLQSQQVVFFVPKYSEHTKSSGSARNLRIYSATPLTCTMYSFRSTSCLSRLIHVEVRSVYAFVYTHCCMLQPLSGNKYYIPRRTSYYTVFMIVDLASTPPRHRDERDVLHMESHIRGGGVPPLQFHSDAQTHRCLAT